MHITTPGKLVDRVCVRSKPFILSTNYFNFLQGTSAFSRWELSDCDLVECYSRYKRRSMAVFQCSCSVYISRVRFWPFSFLQTCMWRLRSVPLRYSHVFFVKQHESSLQICCTLWHKSLTAQPPILHKIDQPVCEWVEVSVRHCSVIRLDKIDYPWWFRDIVSVCSCQCFLHTQETVMHCVKCVAIRTVPAKQTFSAGLLFSLN